jgi:hypothetical protein
VSTAVIFMFATRHEGNAALTERAITSVILSLVATMAAILGMARLGIVAVDNDLAVILLAGALILVSVPQLVWAISLATGRFR